MNPLNSKLIVSGIVFIAALAFAHPAHAVCSMPGGAPNAGAGDIAYNIDEEVMQYCNGTDWISMDGGGGSGMPTCANDEILRYDDPNDEWDCVAMATAETDPQVNTLTNGKWCTSNGTVVNCASDLPIGTLTNGNWCTTNGTIISCNTAVPVTAETDPQVGTLTNTKWCTSNGTAINCTTDPPVLVESDPQVGTLTNTKWCTTDGTAINCTSDAPSGGGADAGTWCGLAQRAESTSGCNVTSPAYVSAFTCNGASVVSSCPAGYTLRTIQTIGGSVCGGYGCTYYYECMRTCSKN